MNEIYSPPTVDNETYVLKYDISRSLDLALKKEICFKIQKLHEVSQVEME